MFNIKKVCAGIIKINNGQSHVYNFTQNSFTNGRWGVWDTDNLGEDMMCTITRLSTKFPDKTYILLKNDTFSMSDHKEFIHQGLDRVDCVFIVPAHYNTYTLPPNVRLLYTPSNRLYTESRIKPHLGEKINRLVLRCAANGHKEFPYTGGPRQQLMDILRDDDRCDIGYTRIGGRPTPQCVKHMSIEEQSRYLGIFVVDGGGFASGIEWVMGSGSVPIIYSIYITGIQKHMIPWYHYVPINEDMRDLKENIDWIFSNPEECKKIIHNALEFYNVHMSFENVIKQTVEHTLS